MNVKSIFIAICTIPLFIQLCAADKLPAFDKTKFWYKSPRITLYNRHSRGASFNSAMRRAQYKVQNPRPAKSAEFVYKAKLDRNGTLDYAKIPLELLEEYGVDRKVQIRVGFPLPQGAVFKPEQIRLLDSTGQERVVQTAITAFWQDKSIKWALLQFSAELKANEKKQLVRGMRLQSQTGKYRKYCRYPEQRCRHHQHRQTQSGHQQKQIQPILI